MKKYLLLLLAVCMLLSSIYVTAYADNNSVEEKLMEAKSKIEQLGDFKLWQNKNVSKKIELFNSDGDLSAYLFNIENESGIIGYILMKPSSYEVIEFALGESPYSEYLTAYMTKNKDTFKDKEHILIYDGPSMYGVCVDDEKSNAKKTHYFTLENSVKVDTMKEVKKLKIDNILQEETLIMPMSTVVEKKLILVYAIAESEGCGPNAGYMIVEYWDKHGYPNLITGVQDEDAVEAELRSLMGSFPVGGQVGTWLDGYVNGLSAYITKRYSSGPIWSIGIPVSYSNMKNEINLSRPSTILYWGNSVYSYHYVVLTGYQDVLDVNHYYIIHDGWDDVDIYRNYETDSNSIGALIRTYVH